jgi:hypothetical protein
MKNDRANEDQDSATASADGEQAQVAVKNLLKRVEDTARARPLVALAMAGGAGLVLARGLPRLWMVAVLGLGGAIGYTLLRDRG